MSIVTVAEAKLHLRVTQSAEDDLITRLIAASEDQIRNFLNSRIPGEDYETPTVPSAIQVAALLIIGGLYENRSDMVEDTLRNNPAVTALLFPYRVEMGI